MICVVGFDDDKVIKDFIRIHVEGLPQPVLSLSGNYPDYQWQGLNVRKMHEQPVWLRKLTSLLPYAVASRRLARLRNSESTARLALKRFFAKHRVDVILAEFGDTGAALAPAARDCGIPLVVHFHGHDAHRKTLLTPGMLLQYQFMFQTAAAVLVVSRHMWQTLAEMGCPAEKLIYNPYGPRERFFDVQPDYHPVVLSVGRFTDIKANYLVLMAFQRVLEKMPQARLVMAGSGELLETCRTLARVWKIDAAVSFPGAVEHSRVHELFAHACCFAQHSVTPSYGDAEGTPNTILEACAAGLPIVATRHAGIADVVVSERTGLLVEELDVAGMAGAMLRMLESAQFCRECGARAREHVRMNFSSEQHLMILRKAVRFAQTGNHSGISSLSTLRFLS